MRRRRRRCLDGLTAPVRLNLHRAARSAAGANYLAAGLALGVAWSFTPLFILHLPFVLATAWLARVSKLAAVAGMMASNPITIAPMLAANFAIGSLLVPADEASPLRNPQRLVDDPSAIFDVGLVDYATLWAGSLVLGGVSGAFVWWFARRWAVAIMHRRERRHAAQRARMGRAP
jgi:uncharacterized protein (DUF2062 family)